MKGKSSIYLKTLGFSRWEKNSCLFKCKCICGKIIDLDRRRTIGANAYRSCGCLKDVNSKTYLWYFRRKMIKNTYLKDDHWIYKSTSKAPLVFLCFRKKHFSIQRLAYMFWNHLTELPENLNISAYCKNKFCINPRHLRALTDSEASKINWMKKRWSTKRKKNETDIRL